VDFVYDVCLGNRENLHTCGWTMPVIALWKSLGYWMFPSTTRFPKDPKKGNLVQAGYNTGHDCL